MTAAKRRRATLRAVDQVDGASPAELRATLKKYAEAFLECRDIGHEWRLANIVRIKGGFQRRWWCVRCKTNRVQTLSPRGYVESNHYEYEDGYVLDGMGRLYADARATMRLVAIERALSRGVGTTLPAAEVDE